jgi:hypothetical protein
MLIQPLYAHFSFFLTVVWRTSDACKGDSINENGRTFFSLFSKEKINKIETKNINKIEKSQQRGTTQTLCFERFFENEDLCCYKERKKKMILIAGYRLAFS